MFILVDGGIKINASYIIEARLLEPVSELGTSGNKFVFTHKGKDYNIASDSKQILVLLTSDNLNVITNELYAKAVFNSL